MKEKVIEKIRKILARANDMTGTTEAERETAMKMAHTLLVKHNLSLSETKEVTEERSKDFFARSSDIWTRSIMDSISELYFCKYFYMKRPDPAVNRDHHFFVGLASNVETAKIISRFVVDSVSQESNVLKRGRRDASSFGRSFCLAAAYKIKERCETLRKEAEAEHNNPSGGTSLVLASLYEQEKLNNQKFIEMELGLSIKNRFSRTRKISREGWDRGTEYGQKVPLNRQVK